MNERSFRSLAPDFAIPAGTQVVLTENLSEAIGKKAGNVGIIIKCPPHNGEPYLVRFPDESELEIRFEQLALRRREIENILHHGGATIEQLRNYIVFQCQVGSHAFGLANENSDTDLRGIYLPPADLHWSLYQLPEQLEFKSDQDDEVYWELEKFIKLALKANPNILEVLWTPKVLVCLPIAERIREARSAFLSNHIFKTYSGYVLSQFRRMRNSFEKHGTYKAKHAMHLTRLLLSGIHALRTGEIMIDVSEHRDQLLTIKSGVLSFEEVRKLALDLDRQFQAAYETTSLPDQPDFDTINQLLLEARRWATNLKVGSSEGGLPQP